MQHIFKQADQFRQRLIAEERAAASEMLRAYGASWANIKGLLDALSKRIEQARSQGQEPGIAWLLREQRYKELLAQARSEMNRFAQFAEKSIVDQQRHALEQAQSNARQLALTGLERPDAVSASVAWNRVPAQALEHLVGTLADGSPLRDIFDSYGDDASEAARSRLITGLAAGYNPRKVAAGMRTDLGNNLARALVISRTEVLRSYRQASMESYKSNQDIVRGWIWIAHLGARTCAACIAMHGTEHPLSEEFFGTHPQCRCSPAPLTSTWEQLGLGSGIPDPSPPQTGIEWFEKQPQSAQRRLLGPAKYLAWSEGAFDLEDIVGYRDDPKWGPVRWERSLRDMIGVADAEAFIRKARNDEGASPSNEEQPPAAPQAPEAPAAAPAGQTPVSAALRVPPGRDGDVLRETIALIDAIHADGNLPSIPVIRENIGYGAEGAFSMSDDTRPQNIIVSPRAEHPHLTAAHEIGHFLDFAGIGNGDFASKEPKQHPEMAGWVDAITQSDAFNMLLRLRGSAGPLNIELADGSIEKVWIHPEEIDYLLSPWELWARSYAQYVAVRSQDPVLLRQLDDRRRLLRDRVIARHWRDDDFVPIAAAIDAMFERLGWK